MNTTVTHTIETRYLLDGVEVHREDLGYEFTAATLRRLGVQHGIKGTWTTQSRTITKTVETTDWR